MATMYRTNLLRQSSRQSFWMLAVFTSLLLVAAGHAQTPARVLGTITEVHGANLTVKTDAGQAYPFTVAPTAVLKQIAPGEKDLSKAAAIPLTSLATGDRVLVRFDPNAAAGSAVALQIIAIKQADLAKKQEADREDWQRRGVGGLVKSVDAASGTIVISSGAGAAAKMLTIHVTNASALRRYAPASVQFDKATLAPITAIRVGDQVRARGNKSADGSEVTAEDLVSGSFRNIAGTVIAVDAAASTLTVKDLATKKSATIKFTAASQLHKLPDEAATRLASLLKSGAQGAGAPPQGAAGGRGPGGGPGGHGGFDAQSLLSHAPTVQLAELKKGEAVMLVATDGDSELTAVTLLAGVAPLLEAPAASNLLSNWSMNSGGEMGQ
jgi:hypothetical protein